MIERKRFLSKLINLEDSIENLKKYFNIISWDSDKELVILENKHLKQLFHQFLNGEIEENILEEWANLIEGRDDIGFANQDVKNIIFGLANPALYGRNDIHKINNYLKQLEAKGAGDNKPFTHSTAPAVECLSDSK